MLRNERQKNPPLLRMVFSIPFNNESVYNLRGAAIFEENAKFIDTYDVIIQRDKPVDIPPDGVPLLIITPPDGNGTLEKYMMHRRQSDRFIIDVTGPTLWPELMDPTLNSQEAIDYWSDPVVQNYGRNSIRRADVVIVNDPDAIDRISDINPNIFLIRDLDTEDVEDALRFVSELTRAILSAQANPNYIDCTCGNCISRGIEQITTELEI